MLDVAPLDALPPRAEQASQESAVEWSELTGALGGMSTLHR
jgi:hypothetical protein